MSYHCGLEDRKRGCAPCKPHIKCDLCGIERTIYDTQFQGYIPALWFLDGLAAPGWYGGRNKNGSRMDHCDKCFKASPEPMPEVEQVPIEALPLQADTLEEAKSITQREDLVNSDPRQSELSVPRDYEFDLALLTSLLSEPQQEPAIVNEPEAEVELLTRLVEALDELESLEE